MRGYGVRSLLLLTISLLFSVAPVVAGEYRLKPGVLQRIMDGGRFGLPQLRVYDGDGYLLGDAGVGYVKGGLSELMEAVTRPDAKADSSRSLIAELADVQTAQGDPPPLPECADFYVVKFWAEWCKPCHVLDAELEVYLEEHPELSLEVYSVEADPDNMALEVVPDASKP